MLMHGSLFTGIGGFDIAAKRCGLRNVFTCEIDEYLHNKLKQNTELYDAETVHFQDIRAAHPPYADIISGGFPCQDTSFANRNNAIGLAGSRSGLWSEYLRIINEIKPLGVVIENVANLLNRGAEYVFAGLAAAGYDAQWRVFQACEFGYPHRRKRLYIVAYPSYFRCFCIESFFKKIPNNLKSCKKQEVAVKDNLLSFTKRDVSWADPAVYKGNDGLLEDDYQMIKAYGNAIVPDIAEFCFEYLIKLIEVNYENFSRT